MRRIFTRKGQNMAILTLEDEKGHIDVTVFPKLYAERAALLVNGNFIVVRGRIEQDSRDDVLRILAERVQPLDDATAAPAGIAQPAAENGEQAVTVSAGVEHPPSTREDGLPDWVLDGNAESEEAPGAVDEPEAVEVAAMEGAAASAATALPREDESAPEPVSQPAEEPLERTGAGG